MNAKLRHKVQAFRQNFSRSGGRISVHIHTTASDSPSDTGSRLRKLVDIGASAALSACILAAGMTAYKAHDSSTQVAQIQATHSVLAAKMAEQAARLAETRRQQELEDQQLGEQGSPEDRLRAQLKYVEIEYLGQAATALDVPSRVLLTKAAAEKYELSKVGLTWKDLYGVIHAETGWVARDGMGLNGKVSRGLAQMEDATAKALGINDPDDPVEAAYGAAKLLVEAAGWSSRKIQGLGLSGAERHEALRDGISIYYNLSSKKRAEWDGTNEHVMPYATQRHMANVKDGAAIAHRLERTLKTQAAAQSRQQAQAPISLSSVIKAYEARQQQENTQAEPSFGNGQSI